MSVGVREALHKAVRREDLTETEAAAVMGEILAGKSSPALIGSLLTALVIKGETTDEIVGFARAMRSAALAIPCKTPRSSLVDTCGTGGDGAQTFNISTVSAFVVAGAGASVAKHGNRSISSRCGSADVLEAAGVNVALTPERMARSIDEAGIGFLFAPTIHTAMKHAGPVRAELKMRTVFNLLGPLTNPAGAASQVVGVFDGSRVPQIAEALARLGVSRAFVVHGSDGLDEITTTSSTRLAEVRDGEVNEREVGPEEFSLPWASSQDLTGGDRDENAAILKAILSGDSGPKRDIVVANAAAALVAAGRAAGFVEGARLASESIDSGKAREKLEDLIRFTNQ